MFNSKPIHRILASDAFTSLPLTIECTPIPTPELEIKTHYELLCPSDLNHKSDELAVNILIDTIKKFQLNGFYGVRLGFDPSNSDTWFPLVDLGSAEGNVFVSTFKEYLSGAMPYTSEECVAKVKKMTGGVA